MYKIYFIIFLQAFLFSGSSYSQSSVETKHNPFTNQVILSHYSLPELQQLQQTDSIKFKTIVYYYTQSFSVESVICSDCIQTDVNSIDISKFEYLRKKETQYTKDFSKYGFKLTLIATDELEYKMPIHLPIPAPLDEDTE